ncbi:MAG: hypothetical protein A2097_03605 [Desulfobacula sp. GWF2_41_7]|nr:MAG: hypothetical protein A2097_03605 [Desulfobacula sp. GWF2_41_7]
MFIRFFLSLPFPKSLRWQFTLALSIPAILIIGGGLISAYGLHLSSDTIQQLTRNTLSNKPASPGSAGQNNSLGQFHVELESQALSLIDFARNLSARFTLDYQMRTCCRRLLRQHQ